MIEASNRFTLVADSDVVFAALDIGVHPSVDIDSEIVRVEIRVLSTAGTSTTVFSGAHTIEVPFSQIDGYTSSGSTDLEKFFNRCEQAAKEYLEDVPENSAITFAIV